MIKNYHDYNNCDSLEYKKAVKRLFVATCNLLLDGVSAGFSNSQIAWPGIKQ
jgi:hypothetical protein